MVLLWDATELNNVAGVRLGTRAQAHGFKMLLIHGETESFGLKRKTYRRGWRHIPIFRIYEHKYVSNHDDMFCVLIRNFQFPRELKAF